MCIEFIKILILGVGLVVNKLGKFFVVVLIKKLKLVMYFCFVCCNLLFNVFWVVVKGLVLGIFRKEVILFFI